MSASQAANKKIFRMFTAVDLVTIAALAALFRAMDYVTGAFAAFFPFSSFIMIFACLMFAVAAAVIVRKAGTFTLFVIAAQAINLFLQGEILLAVLIMLSWGLLSDFWIYTRLKAGVDPFKSMRDMTIAGILMSLTWVISHYDINFPFVYMVNLSFTVYVILTVVGFIIGSIGGVVGYFLGDKVKGLLH
jgi:hypothetical protein